MCECVCAHIGEGSSSNVNKENVHLVLKKRSRLYISLPHLHEGSFHFIAVSKL